MAPAKDTSASASVQESLGRPEIHASWESAYRTRANERFYERVFDELARLLPDRGGTTFLDVGCGLGAHSLRLARRGFTVSAVDFSESILEQARENVRANGLAGRITVEQADLLALPFRDDAFDNVLCWGVLMHVPEMARAMTELARVTAPGGVLVINEVNARAPEARALQIALPRLAKSDISVERTQEGVEHWSDTESGPLMWRHADVRWLIHEMSTYGLRLRTRRAAQLSELYTRSPRPIAAAIHAANGFWFDRVRRPGLALGNLLIFEKPDEQAGDRRSPS